MEMHKGSFRALFSTKGNLRCLYYSLGLMFFQQMSGINIVTFYSKTIFQESGSSFSANLSSIIVAVVMTFASMLTITAAKIFRVKDLLCFSALGEIFSMVSKLILHLSWFFDFFSSFTKSFMSVIGIVDNTYEVYKHNYDDLHQCKFLVHIRNLLLSQASLWNQIPGLVTRHQPCIIYFHIHARYAQKNFFSLILT